MAAEAAVYSVSFQGATFTFTTNSTTNATFDITGLNNMSGNWAGAPYLGAFAFNNIGSPGGITTTLTTPNTGQFATSDGGDGLSASAGCSTNGNFYCFNFSPNIAIPANGHLAFSMVATSGTFNIGSGGPELKIFFSSSPTLDNNDTKIGDLFSNPIPPGTGNFVPEPATWAMLIMGFGMVGAGMRMRRRRGIALAA